MNILIKCLKQSHNLKNNYIYYFFRWKERKIIKLKNPLLKFEAFEALMNYFYTNTFNISLELIESFLLICKQVNIIFLIKAILV